VPEELLQLVDRRGRPAGTAPRAACHGDPSLIQAVVHLYLFDAQGRLYLQRRSAAKDTYPGCWDTSVGGHLAPGESPEEGLKREAREELSLQAVEARPLASYLFRSEYESEYVFAFQAVCDGKPQPNPEEIDEGRFFRIEELREMVRRQPAAFTPHFRRAFRLLLTEGRRRRPGQTRCFPA
jgi:isopentenyl-diphosphate delta-isomerase type 1